jgi:glycosyltransferase involved in cell wall biosynthesis
MKHVEVSVYTPVYNGEKFISQTIDSVLTQSFNNFEYIIVNDGSIDNTHNIIRNYAKKDNRIKILSQKNGGLANASNSALKACSGKYFIRIDADDICFEDRIKKQYQFMENNPSVTVCGSLVKTIGSTKSIISNQPKNDFEIRVYFLFNPAIANPTHCIRKSFIDKYHIEYDSQMRYAEDFDFWSRMSFYEDCVFHNLQEPLVYYRLHNNSLTNSTIDEIKFPILNRIRSRHFYAIGLKPSAHEMYLHSLLADRRLIEDFDLFEEEIAWINKILKKNNNAKYVDNDILKNILFHRLYQAYSRSDISSLQSIKWYLDNSVQSNNVSIFRKYFLVIRKIINNFLFSFGIHGK